MTRAEIVETLAREKRVEQICSLVTHWPAGEPDLKDLGQHIYLVRLGYDEKRLQDLGDHGEINFIIVRLALNNFRSATSRFHYLSRVFSSRTVSLSGLDFPDK